MRDELTGSPFDLSDRVALVTGAGRGIGRAIALGLAAAGADVAVSARSADQLAEVCHEIRSLGGRALALPADLADLDVLASVFKSVESEFGRLDILFNNAGTGFRKPLLEITQADWDRVADLNLRSLFFACQHGIRLMQPRGYGRIINTASLTSFLGFAQVSVYGATKGGVAQLTKALAVEFAQSGITINAIAPGYVLYGTHASALRRPRDPRLAHGAHSPGQARGTERHDRHSGVSCLGSLGLPYRRRNPRRRGLAGGLKRSPPVLPEVTRVFAAIASDVQTKRFPGCVHRRQRHCFQTGQRTLNQRRKSALPSTDAAYVRSSQRSRHS